MSIENAWDSYDRMLLSVQGHAQCACMLQVSQYSIVGVLEVFHLIDYIRMSARPHIHTSVYSYTRGSVHPYTISMDPYVRTSILHPHICTTVHPYNLTSVHPHIRTSVVRTPIHWYIRTSVNPYIREFLHP